MTLESSRPWRNPMLALVIGLPLLSMVFGIGMVVIASRHADHALPDTVRRTAQVQVADLAPDERAARAGLQAVVRIERDRIEVIPVRGDFERNRDLRLYALHPTHADADLAFALSPSRTGWSASARIPRDVDWRLRLQPADGRWRIGARAPRRQQAVVLLPAVVSAN